MMNIFREPTIIVNMTCQRNQWFYRLADKMQFLNELVLELLITDVIFRQKNHISFAQLQFFL